MEICPTEIWLRIFREACTDDGSTGRSLSLVSRYVNETSREFKLQSIAIVGMRQILTCAAMLEATPARYRQVRDLFLSNCPQFDQYPQTPVYRLIESPNENVASPEHYPGVCEAFYQILVLTSPTLQTFYLASNIPRTAVILPISMPALTEFTVYGPCPAWSDVASKTCVFPSLRRVRYLGYSDYPMDLFEDLAACAPKITHLSFIPSRPSRHLHEDLAVAMNVPRHPGRARRRIAASFGFEESEEDGLVIKGRLPTTLRRVYVQLGLPPKAEQGHTMGEVHRLMVKRFARLEKLEKRLTVLPPASINGFSECKLNWLYGEREDLD